MGETATAQTGLVLDIEQLKKLIPHRWPFIFIERLHDIVPYKSAIGHKTVGINEPHFLGHFPNFSVMPGVLIIEALAQTAGPAPEVQNPATRRQELEDAAELALVDPGAAGSAKALLIIRGYYQRAPVERAFLGGFAESRRQRLHTLPRSGGRVNWDETFDG